MNKIDAKHFMRFIQALTEGKTIQIHSPKPDVWTDMKECYFNLPYHYYRIKPEPEVVYVNKWASGPVYVYATEDDARQGSLYGRSVHEYDYVAKKFVEAL